jgi:hypothetical protein
MQQPLTRLRAAATPRTVAAAMLAYLASLALLQWADMRLAPYAGSFTKPDLFLNYDFSYIFFLFTYYGEAGRTAYAWNLAADSLMPIFFAAAVMLVAARAFPRRFSLLVAAPLGFLVLDLIENASFGWMLVQYPDLSAGLVAATNVVTLTKLACFAVAMPTLLLGVGRLAYRYIAARRRPVVKA